MTKLEGKSIQLRAIEPEDLEIIHKWENDTNIWELSTTLSPFSKYVIKQYIANSHLDIYETKQLRFIIEKDKVAIGAIDLFDFDPFHQRAGIGVLIHKEENRSQGNASEALELLINYCFKTLCLKQLYCNITSDNAPSLALFSKHGFTQIGIKKDWIKTNKGWKDEIMMQFINDYHL